MALLALGLLLATAAYLLAPDCAAGGAMGSRYQECRCRGVEWVVFGRTAADGPRLTRCLGLVTERTCYRHREGPVVPCVAIPTSGKRESLLPGSVRGLLATAGPVQAAAEPAYTEVFYPSGGLRIQAYVYKPDGPGPFPVVIYNHGSRAGRERVSVPHEYIGQMLTRAGYLVVVPERRGYGKSDGTVWRQEVTDPSRLVPRLQAETDDVLAAVGHLRTLPYADTKRIGIMGWSFGGIVTMLAVSRSTAFAVAVDQAGGALTWDRNAHVRSALTAAAERAVTPILLLVAQNDRTTASITELGDVFKRRGVAHRVVIYAPFTAREGGEESAPGHRLFSAAGVGVWVWEQDVVEFLGRYLGREP